MRESRAANDPLRPPRWLQWSLTALAMLIMALLLVMPLAMVLGAAFGEGVKVWFAALVEPDARAALELTLVTAAVVIPLNAFFGLATAWAVTRFEFRGKRILLALIDLPFAVSPVVAGLCLVLLFGREGWFAPLIDRFGLEILFARPGIILATLFITSTVRQGEAVTAEKTDNHKCGRCWRYLPEVPEDGDLCARCEEVVNA